MKRYGGSTHQLGDESAEDGQVGIKVTVCNEFGKLLQRSEHAENRLLEEWVLTVGTAHCRTARHLCKPLRQLQSIHLVKRSVWQFSEDQVEPFVL